jgi:hypothetical protein
LSKFNTEEDSASEASTGSLGFQETVSLGIKVESLQFHLH